MSETGFSMTTDAPADATLPGPGDAVLAGTDAPEGDAPEADEDAGNVFAVTKGAGETYSVTDASGRALVIKKLSQIERARMFEAVEDVASYQWIAMASAALSVRSINAVPCPFPSNKKEVENRFTQLGDDGMDAAQNVLAMIIKGKKMNRYQMHGENPVAAKN
ncbi:MAG: hypothetical protein ACRYHQ_14640 [Janthinobacterium lividum]